MKDVRKQRFAKNEFVARKSLLDQTFQDSSIGQSPFKGLFRLALYICFLNMTGQMFLRIFMNHEYLELTQFYGCLNDFKLGIYFWAALHFFTYLSFLN